MRFCIAKNLTQFSRKSHDTNLQLFGASFGAFFWSIFWSISWSIFPNDVLPANQGWGDGVWENGYPGSEEERMPNQNQNNRILEVLRSIPSPIPPSLSLSMSKKALANLIKHMAADNKTTKTNVHKNENGETCFFTTFSLWGTANLKTGVRGGGRSYPPYSLCQFQKRWWEEGGLLLQRAVFTFLQSVSFSTIPSAWASGGIVLHSELFPGHI